MRDKKNKRITGRPRREHECEFKGNYSYDRYRQGWLKAVKYEENRRPIDNAEIYERLSTQLPDFHLREMNAPHQQYYLHFYKDQIYKNFNKSNYL